MKSIKELESAILQEMESFSIALSSSYEKLVELKVQLEEATEQHDLADRLAGTFSGCDCPECRAERTQEILANLQSAGLRLEREEEDSEESPADVFESLRNEFGIRPEIFSAFESVTPFPKDRPVFVSSLPSLPSLSDQLWAELSEKMWSPPVGSIVGKLVPVTNSEIHQDRPTLLPRMPWGSPEDQFWFQSAGDWRVVKEPIILPEPTTVELVTLNLKWENGKLIHDSVTIERHLA